MRNDFESNYLMHWGLKKGAKAEKHKYYERVEKNGKYLYFYTQAEYEAWLHKGNSALEGAKDKAKGLLDKAKSKLGSLAKDSNSKIKNKVAMTRQNLVNAVNVGYSQTTNLLAKAQKQLTKSNAQAVLDRGNKAISSIINKSSNAASNIQKQVQSTASNIQKEVKATSATVQNKAKSIASNVEKTVKQAGKDTSKVVSSYISKGEKAIKSTLSKASNMTVSQATQQHGNRGVAIIGPVLATVAAALVIRAAVKVVKAVVNEVKDRRDYKKQVEENKKEREEAIARKFDPKEKAKAQERMKEFSNDAKDSYKENLVEHTDIPQKDTVSTADEDMMAINSNVSETAIYQQYEDNANKYEELWAKYEETGDYKYLKEAEKYRKEALELFYHNAGYLQNCANCTLTYDLRRRGYDVDAPWNDMGTADFAITNWYKLDTERDIEYWNADDTQQFSKQEAKDMVDYMNNQYPDGAYGHFCITWSEGGGHDCVWSKEGGKIIIRDCQTGQVLNPEEYILKANDIYYFRADDKELSDAAYNIANADQTNSFGDDVSDDKENQYAQWYNDYDYYKRRKEYERYK